jgi:spore coat protein U-like protein
MAVAGGPAMASPPAGQAQFNITATVAGSCTLSAQDANLGSYDPASDLDGTVQFTYDCTPGLSASISLDGGQYRSGIFSGMRSTSLGAGTDLSYEIYQENYHSTVWADGSFGTSPESVTGDGNSDVVTGYIVVPNGQTNASAGSVSDTVTATINW